MVLYDRSSATIKQRKLHLAKQRLMGPYCAEQKTSPRKGKIVLAMMKIAIVRHEMKPSNFERWQMESLILRRERTVKSHWSSLRVWRDASAHVRSFVWLSYPKCPLGSLRSRTVLSVGELTRTSLETFDELSSFVRHSTKRSKANLLWEGAKWVRGTELEKWNICLACRDILAGIQQGFTRSRARPYYMVRALIPSEGNNNGKGRLAKCLFLSHQ